MPRTTARSPVDLLCVVPRKTLKMRFCKFASPSHVLHVLRFQPLRRARVHHLPFFGRCFRVLVKQPRASPLLSRALWWPLFPGPIQAAALARGP